MMSKSIVTKLIIKSNKIKKSFHQVSSLKLCYPSKVLIPKIFLSFFWHLAVDERNSVIKKIEINVLKVKKISTSSRYNFLIINWRISWQKNYTQLTDTQSHLQNNPSYSKSFLYSCLWLNNFLFLFFNLNGKQFIFQNGRMNFERILLPFFIYSLSSSRAV